MNINTGQEQQRATIRLEMRRISDRSMNFFLIGYFVIGLFFAMRYDTWLLAIGSGGICLVAYYSVKYLLPDSNAYQYVLSAILGIFMAQYIYQMHGLFEMHFFAFIGSVVLVTYQNWKLQIPMLIVVTLHHTLLNNLQAQGYKNIFFSELGYLDTQTFFIHIILAGAIFFICGLWGFQLKRYNETKISQNIEMVRLQGEAILHNERKRNEEVLEQANEELRKAKQNVESAYLEAEKERNLANQANMAKGVFLATMSHEIRTPMNGVIGMSSLLAETSLSEQQRLYTDTIISCGESLLNVINDILDFSKIEAGNMELEEEEFNLRKCIEDVLDIFGTKAYEKRLELMYEIDQAVPLQIVGDNLRLKQVITNLVSNAMKFTDYGDVYISVCVLEYLRDGKIKLEFQVRDSGIGIPAHKMERLFKSFSQVDSSTTRKYGGTGLGLVISQKLVNLMNGDIVVKSEQGKGSTFIFTLVTRPGTKMLEQYTQYNMSDQKNKRILVVDDNYTNRLILKKQLEHWELVPVMADSGEEALRILSDKDHFDLVFTDMQMPHMDGVELALAIRKRFPPIPIILLSSIGDERNQEHLMVFSSILTKPIKVHLLGKHILSGLSRHDKSIAETIKKEKTRSDFAKEFPLEILVAEDNLINQQVISRILSSLGYQPTLVENGIEAVASAVQKDYDLVLMDMQMPEMNGIEATMAIRSQLHKQPVIIALTANTLEGDQEDCLHAGMNDFLSKPVRIDDLTTMLEKWALHRAIVT